MFRIAICFTATLLMLSGSAYKCEFAYNNYLRSTTSAVSSTGELSESDALAVVSDYIEVHHMTQKDFVLKLMRRQQNEKEDYYLLVYSRPVPGDERSSGTQGYEISTMPVFDLEYFFRVEAKTGNVEHTVIEHRR